VPLAVGDRDTRDWRGDAIAFVAAEHHAGLLPLLLQALLVEIQPRCSRDAAEMQPRCSRDAAEIWLLQALLVERRNVKRRVKQLREAAASAADKDLADVLDVETSRD